MSSKTSGIHVRAVSRVGSKYAPRPVKDIEEERVRLDKYRELRWGTERTKDLKWFKGASYEKKELRTLTRQNRQLDSSGVRDDSGRERGGA